MVPAIPGFSAIFANFWRWTKTSAILVPRPRQFSTPNRTNFTDDSAPIR
jgi:hypothetical protein